MTPAEHITMAEALLANASIPAGDQYLATASPLVQQAIAHCLIAVAVELGAPHPAAPAGGEPSAPQAPPG